MSELNPELVAHLDSLEGVEYVILPEGASKEFESYGRYGFEIAYNTPYEIKISKGEWTHGKYKDNPEPYHYGYISGFFGVDDEGYVIGELEELTDEELIRFVAAPPRILSGIETFKGMVSQVDELINRANKYSNENNLGQEMQFSADSGTIAAWNSSRC